MEMSSLPKEMLSNLKRPVLFFEQRSLATIALMHVHVPMLFTGYCQEWGTFLFRVTVY